MARSPASLTLAACILLAFLMVPVERFALRPDDIRYLGCYWLAHAGWWHLLFNVAVLATAGSDLERHTDTPRFLQIAAGGALGGGLLGWAFLGPEQALVGASGINYAILGAAVACPHPRLRDAAVGLFLLSDWRGKVSLVAVGLLCIPTSWVHLGGMLSGAVLARTTNRLRPRPAAADARSPEPVRLLVPPEGPLPRRAGTTR
jgi:membrane associated rhomboid family serine protease